MDAVVPSVVPEQEGEKVKKQQVNDPLHVVARLENRNCSPHDLIF